MPIIVDEEARRALIAEATLRLAQREGVGAVTIRAVARELGRSTVFVTNYLGTRTELLLNVLSFVRTQWDRALDGLAGDGRPNLWELVRWSATEDEFDRTVRHLWLEVLSRPTAEPELFRTLREDARRQHDDLAAASRVAVPSGALADLVYLALRGYYVSSIEDAERWTPERVQAALGHLLELAGALPDTEDS